MLFVIGHKMNGRLPLVPSFLRWLLKVAWTHRPAGRIVSYGRVGCKCLLFPGEIGYVFPWRLATNHHLLCRLQQSEEEPSDLIRSRTGVQGTWTGSMLMWCKQGLQWSMCPGLRLPQLFEGCAAAVPALVCAVVSWWIYHRRLHHRWVGQIRRQPMGWI